MDKLKVQNTATEAWYELVLEAQSHTAVRLPHEIESYLVFLLMRFTDEPALAESVLGLEFLEGHQGTSREQHEVLRGVADKCLLFSGFFPEHAERRRVSLTYFVELGQSAYYTLSGLPERIWAGPYPELCVGFVSMMDVLQAMRALNPESDGLQPLQAAELWQETGSQQAYQTLTLYGDPNTFVLSSKDKDHQLH